jgi:hypothetical protein
MSTVESSFSGGAWITSANTGHSREHDHYGTQPDTVVVIDGPVGAWPTGTELHTVLADMVARITALESANHRVGVVFAGAFVQPWLSAAAVIFKASISGSRTADAVVVLGKTNQPIAADAMLILRASTSLSAGAWIIDDVSC